MKIKIVPLCLRVQNNMHTLTKVLIQVKGWITIYHQP